jgi:hypothetical protein
MIKFEANINSNRFENNLRLFAAMLIGTEQLKEFMTPIGQDMVAEARSRVPQKTGNLFKHIKFIPTDTGGALTTRNSLAKSYKARGVKYAAPVESGADIKATGKRRNHGERKQIQNNLKYLVFKIDGEWKKVPSVQTRPRPFLRPVFEEFWFGPNPRGYKALSDALIKKADEALRT